MWNCVNIIYLIFTHLDESDATSELVPNMICKAIFLQ